MSTKTTIAAAARVTGSSVVTAGRLPKATIRPHRSASRGHSDHGWLDTYHSFSFADWYSPQHTRFGGLRVLNEDRVQAGTGFPTHPHRDFEIFSYVLAGELTHRDSLVRKDDAAAEAAAAAGGGGDRFSRLRRGDVQFTTGGTGIAHSEYNEHARDTVHFLQIWAVPWARGLPPTYHTKTFPDAAKRAAGAAGGFVPILSPLVGGPAATAEQEEAAQPTLPDTVPIHADFGMGATLLAAAAGETDGAVGTGAVATWTVGLGAAGKVTQAAQRKVYVHLPMTSRNRSGPGRAQIRLAGRADAVLEEGDGAYVDGVTAGDQLTVESIGTAEAEVIVLDTA